MAFIKLLLYALESTEEFNHIKRQNSVLIVTLNYIIKMNLNVLKNAICKHHNHLEPGVFGTSACFRLGPFFRSRHRLLALCLFCIRN